mgnify:CR=1 FL=1
MPWFTESWSKGHLLGVTPDPNSGYRATVWFEYTRNLFNEIREGSLIAVRNFSDRSRTPDGRPEGDRNATYEEYSILQIDLVHPWHYAIQGASESGFPAFNVASAISARQDWTSMDTANRDDVSRIKCEAIPLRLAFRRDVTEEMEGANLPRVFTDRSMPMPGYEAYLLRPIMTQAILNKGLNPEVCIDMGNHVVQHDVIVRLQLPELLRLHFGVFGYTGAGKSNLVSTLTRKSLGRAPEREGERVFKVVLFDLMDEYTGLLIDQLISHRWSRIVVVGRGTLPQSVLTACEAVVSDDADATNIAREAAEDWASRIVLPTELAEERTRYISPLRDLILQRKILFFETAQEQGTQFDITIDGLITSMGSGAYRNQATFRERTQQLRNTITPLIDQARDTIGGARDQILEQIIVHLTQELNQVATDTARRAINTFIGVIRQHVGSRGALRRGLGTSPRAIAGLLNWQPRETHHTYQPSLTIVIGESDNLIARFSRFLIDETFNQRRENSLLYPTISFIFDEADVFISSADRIGPASVIEQATLLARRGRKFGLGLGIATQRVRYLDTSIMAQPHTYFISKLPRKSDRDVVAEAFAISDATFEQTFAFTTGQWLVASHDATGLRGTPFPVRVENANARIIAWLNLYGR